MKTCVLALTTDGKVLAKRIADLLDGCSLYTGDLKTAEAIRYLWREYDGIICVMATGIVVRSIAPLLVNKTTDPCVLVLDQNGEHVISLLSGHLGGGNELAYQVASITGGSAVITTASDVTGKTALDLWARRNSLHIIDKGKLTEKSAQLINSSILKIYSGLPLLDLPSDFQFCSDPAHADIVITYNKHMTLNGLCCIPEILYIGVGCNRGTPVQDIEQSFMELCEENGIDSQAVAGIASIDLKNDEQGILQFAKNYHAETYFFTRNELNSVGNVSFSPAVMKAVGVQGVAEPAALLAARLDGSEAELIIPKMKWKDVTLAVAERKKIKWD